MDDLASDLRELKADFQRLADRARWVRAVANWNLGGFGLFSFGHAGGDGVNGAVLLAGDKHDQPLFTELHSLTDQAGALALALVQTRRFKWKPVQSKAALGDHCQPWEFWLLFLTRTPPVLFNCSARHLDGSSTPTIPLFEENDVLFWIDNYPQVCVSALAHLKAGLRVQTGQAAEDLPPSVPPPSVRVATGKGAKRKTLSPDEERAVALWNRRDVKEIPDYETLSKHLKEEGINLSPDSIGALLDKVRKRNARANKSNSKKRRTN